MNRCPLEICLSIFSLACTDEGYTGRSLSLVSKAFADASRPVQLQSIALHGPSQICGFASMLKKRNDCDRRVRNLFVSLKARTRRVDLPPSEEQCFQATEFILSLTSPHLSILFLWWKGRTTMQLMTCLAQTDLQRLTELSFDSSPQARNTSTGDFFKLRAPNLRCLHLSFYRDLVIPSSLPSLLSRSCPCLSHLYLARVIFWKLPSDFVDAISYRVSRASPSKKGVDPFPATLNTLTLDRIVSRFHADPEETLSGEALELETKMSELADCNSSFLCVNRVVGNHSRTYKSPQWWNERITGGEGCWIDRF
ncbi:hypothetical protein NLI96_g7152 [Meripilus lineatus]|uniref:Uncharacterized protein n=1 Tax=Meripilus lineatus TaxID=2056292 RepID=A0AAD5V4Y3_9APHY|nr:hypothetical protein NLI96_g7152 [Physisporinus lineatus]